MSDLKIVARWGVLARKSARNLARLEKRGIVPLLAVRVWAEEIGGISFIGSHPALSPFYTQSEYPAI
jgi:hypothetical protein